MMIPGMTPQSHLSNVLPGDPAWQPCSCLFEWAAEPAPDLIGGPRLPLFIEKGGQKRADREVCCAQTIDRNKTVLGGF